MRSLSRATLLAAALSLSGCLTTGDPVPLDEAGVESDSDSGTETSAEVTGDVASESATGPVLDAGEVDAAEATTDATETTDDASDSAETSEVGDVGGEVDAPVSTTCGDGIRDLVFEECDLASTSSRAVCSACRSVDLLALAAPATVDAGVPSGKRWLGLGRHTIAADPSGGFAVVFGEDKPARLLVTRFSSTGVASDATTSFAADASPLLAAQPVIAATGGVVVAVWTDSAIDGDGPGIAARLVGTGSSPLGPVVKVNVVHNFTQQGADILRVGPGFLIAWSDLSNVARGADLKYRLFSATLAPLGGEVELAGTLDTETDVALASFGSGWMAAWRAAAASGATETVVAKVDGKSFYAGPLLPGPEGAKPAIAEVDGTHALVAFVAGVGIGSYEARVALLDTASPGVVMSTVVAAKAREVNLVRAGGKVWMTWRADAASGDVNGEELWLKELAVSSAGLDLSKAAIPLPRSGEHRVGDQRQVSLAGWGPTGFLATWEDFGGGLAKTAMHPDVVVEFLDVPILRLGGSDGGT